MKLQSWYVVAMLSVGSVAQAQKGPVLSDARVAPDARKFAFSVAVASAFGVYEQNLTADSTARKISLNTAAFHCFAPSYSPDGRFLLYLKEPISTAKKANYADVMLYNRQTHSTTQLTAGKQNITQALFSPDGKRIVYAAAGFFGSYSPVGPKMAHELDVYSMALDGTNQLQHSALKAYTLGNIMLLQAPDTYLLNIFNPRKNLSGLYAFSLSDSTQFRLVKDSVVLAHQLNYFPNPTISTSKELVFSIGDELFAKNMKTGRSTLVYAGHLHSNPHPMAFVGSQLVLFSETFRDTSGGGFGAFRISLLNLEDQKIIPVAIKLD